MFASDLSALLITCEISMNCSIGKVPNTRLSNKVPDCDEWKVRNVFELWIKRMRKVLDVDFTARLTKIAY